MNYLLLLCFSVSVLHGYAHDDMDLHLVVHDVENRFRGMTHLPNDVVNQTSGHSRHPRMVGCNCGPGTESCREYVDGKLCKCSNNLWVIDADCQDCKCQNGLCDFRDGTCDCLRGYRKKDNECIPCNCGNNINCHFQYDHEFCDCDGRIVLDSKCDECVCGKHEFCFMRGVDIHCFCDSGVVSKDPKCENCTCEAGAETCTVFDKEKVCKCSLGYAELNGVCTECKCPPTFQCSFVEGRQTCACKDGFVKHDKENVCKECFCGEGHGCGISADGTKTCLCNDKHIENNGTCTQCNCSENEICEVQDGFVVCVCKESYIWSEIKRTCLECFCGEGHDCELIKDEKLCICEQKFAEKNGICRECDCGTNHSCEFQDGKKLCHCSQNYSNKNGKCEECFCGEDSTCVFEGGQKVCICKEGYVDNEGTCEECDCGFNSSCEFVNGTKRCICPEFHMELNSVCMECDCGFNISCESVNGTKRCICPEFHTEIDSVCIEMCHPKTCIHGVCKMYGETSFCICNEGFSGSRCEENTQQQRAEATSKTPVVISVLTVATLLCIAIVSIFVFKRFRRRSQGYTKSDLIDKSEVLYANSEMFQNNETRM